MKSYFSSLFALILVCITSLFPGEISAAPGDPLSVNAVKVLDNKNIQVTFSEAIDTESVVLKITKQSDNSSVKTESITNILDSGDAVRVGLDDTLSEASSYTLTVVAAIGKSGATIVDGATALQDFVTPSPLKVAASETTLNAPSNPNAIMDSVKKDEPKVQVPTPAKTSATPPEKPKITEPTPTEELPLTGPSTYLFLSIALITSYFFLRRKAL